MHPSLQAKYKLRTAADVAIAERMIAAARRGGWTETEIDAVLSFYAEELLPKLEGGAIDAAAAVTALWDWGGARGIPDARRAALLRWHTETSDYLASHAGELPPLAAATAQAAAQERAEIERIMREEPQRYWRDEALQNRLHDLIEAELGGGAVAPRSDQGARLGAIEAQMYLPDGRANLAYWGNAELQNEYREILGSTAPALPGPSEGATS